MLQPPQTPKGLRVESNGNTALKSVTVRAHSRDSGLQRRVAILQALARAQALSPGELERRVGLPRRSLSYYLSQLQRQGLVERKGGTGKCPHAVYVITPRGYAFLQQNYHALGKNSVCQAVCQDSSSPSSPRGKGAYRGRKPSQRKLGKLERHSQLGKLDRGKRQLGKLKAYGELGKLERQRVQRKLDQWLGKLDQLGKPLGELGKLVQRTLDQWIGKLQRVHAGWGCETPSANYICADKIALDSHASDNIVEARVVFQGMGPTWGELGLRVPWRPFWRVLRALGIRLPRKRIRRVMFYVRGGIVHFDAVVPRPRDVQLVGIWPMRGRVFALLLLSFAVLKHYSVPFSLVEAAWRLAPRLRVA